MNYVGLLTLLLGCEDKCGKLWRTIQLIKVEESKIPVNPLMLFRMRKQKKKLIKRGGKRFADIWKKYPEKRQKIRPRNQEKLEIF